MKPWVLVLTLATHQFANAGYVPEEGVDRFFQGRAEGGAKPVLGLETIESQFDVFDSLPLSLQVDALEGMLAQEGDGSLPSPDALVEAWSRGDVKALEEIMFADLGDDPQLDAFYEAMYFRRNRDMARRIASLLEGRGDSLFVVVGAGHMVGSRGIPALLAERGFQVEQVSRTP
jgi:uncharacterized protein YbaP (TraB family)